MLYSKTKCFKALSVYLVTVFSFTSVGLRDAFAAIAELPQPGSMLQFSQQESVPLLKGLRFDPNDPLNIQFVIEKANGAKTTADEATRLINYFLTSLTVAQEDIWVNLSPYESDRIMDNELAETELGQELLEQDYILKQLSASLTHPDTDTGADYWKQLSSIDSQFSTQSEALGKIWIMPEEVEIFEGNNAAYVTKSTMKVESEIETSDVLLSKIAEDVNKGQNFAKLRQVYNAIILANWFKAKFKNSFYSFYFDSEKTKGIDLAEEAAKDKVYNMYVEAFKKGAYDFIKKEYDTNINRKVKKHYFSGGIITESSPIMTSDPAKLYSSSVEVFSTNTRLIDEYDNSLLSSALKTVDDLELRHEGVDVGAKAEGLTKETLNYIYQRNGNRFGASYDKLIRKYMYEPTQSDLNAAALGISEAIKELLGYGLAFDPNYIIGYMTEIKYRDYQGPRYNNDYIYDTATKIVTDYLDSLIDLRNFKSLKTALELLIESDYLRLIDNSWLNRFNAEFLELNKSTDDLSDLDSTFERLWQIRFDWAMRNWPTKPAYDEAGVKVKKHGVLIKDCISNLKEHGHLVKADFIFNMLHAKINYYEMSTGDGDSRITYFASLHNTIGDVLNAYVQSTIDNNANPSMFLKAMSYLNDSEFDAFLTDLTKTKIEKFIEETVNSNTELLQTAAENYNVNNDSKNRESLLDSIGKMTTTLSSINQAVSIYEESSEIFSDLLLKSDKDIKTKLLELISYYENGRDFTLFFIALNKDLDDSTTQTLTEFFEKKLLVGWSLPVKDSENVKELFKRSRKGKLTTRPFVAAYHSFLVAKSMSSSVSASGELLVQSERFALEAALDKELEDMLTRVYKSEYSVEALIKKAMSVNHSFNEKKIEELINVFEDSKDFKARKIVFKIIDRYYKQKLAPGETSVAFNKNLRSFSAWYTYGFVKKHLSRGVLVDEDILDRIYRYLVSENKIIQAKDFFLLYKTVIAGDYTRTNLSERDSNVIVKLVQSVRGLLRLENNSGLITDESKGEPVTLEFDESGTYSSSLTMFEDKLLTLLDEIQTTDNSEVFLESGMKLIQELDKIHVHNKVLSDDVVFKAFEALRSNEEFARDIDIASKTQLIQSLYAHYKKQPINIVARNKMLDFLKREHKSTYSSSIDILEETDDMRTAKYETMLENGLVNYGYSNVVTSSDRDKGDRLVKNLVILEGFFDELSLTNTKVDGLLLLELVANVESFVDEGYIANDKKKYMLSIYRFILDYYMPFIAENTKSDIVDELLKRMTVFEDYNALYNYVVAGHYVNDSLFKKAIIYFSITDVNKANQLDVAQYKAMGVNKEITDEMMRQKNAEELTKAMEDVVIDYAIYANNAKNPNVLAFKTQYERSLAVADKIVKELIKKASQNKNGTFYFEEHIHIYNKFIKSGVAGDSLLFFFQLLSFDKNAASYLYDLINWYQTSDFLIKYGADIILNSIRHGGRSEEYDGAVRKLLSDLEETPKFAKKVKNVVQKYAPDLAETTTNSSAVDAKISSTWRRNMNSVVGYMDSLITLEGDDSYKKILADYKKDMKNFAKRLKAKDNTAIFFVRDQEYAAPFQAFVDVADYKLCKPLFDALAYDSDAAEFIFSNIDVIAAENMKEAVKIIETAVEYGAYVEGKNGQGLIDDVYTIVASAKNPKKAAQITQKIEHKLLLSKKQKQSSSVEMLDGGINFDGVAQGIEIAEGSSAIVLPVEMLEKVAGIKFEIIGSVEFDDLRTLYTKNWK